MDPGSDAYRGDGDEILDPGAQMHTGMTGKGTYRDDVKGQILKTLQLLAYCLPIAYRPYFPFSTKTVLYSTSNAISIAFSSKSKWSLW